MFNTKKEKLTLVGILALFVLVNSVVDNGLGFLIKNSKTTKCEEKLDSLLGKTDSIVADVNTLVLDADTLKANADTLKRATREIKTMVQEDLDLDRNTNEVVNGCTPPRCGKQPVVRKPVKRDSIQVVDTTHVRPEVSQDTAKVTQKMCVVTLVCHKRTRVIQR